VFYPDLFHILTEQITELTRGLAAAESAPRFYAIVDYADMTRKYDADLYKEVYRVHQ